MSYDRDAEWNELKVQELDKQIKKFKEDMRNLYSQYQVSGLRTENVYALDHICDDIRRMGSLRNSDAGLYESSHIKVKEAYRSGSKRKHITMDEMLHAFIMEMGNNKLREDLETNNRQAVKEDDAPKRGLAIAECIRTDCAALVRNGKCFRLSDFKHGRVVIRAVRKENEKVEKGGMGKCIRMFNLSKVVQELLSDLGEEGSKVL